MEKAILELESTFKSLSHNDIGKDCFAHWTCDQHETAFRNRTFTQRPAKIYVEEQPLRRQHEFHKDVSSLNFYRNGGTSDE